MKRVKRASTSLLLVIRQHILLRYIVPLATSRRQEIARPGSFSGKYSIFTKRVCTSTRAILMLIWNTQCHLCILLRCASIEVQHGVGAFLELMETPLVLVLPRFPQTAHSDPELENARLMKYLCIGCDKSLFSCRKSMLPETLLRLSTQSQVVSCVVPLFVLLKMLSGSKCATQSSRSGNVLQVVLWLVDFCPVPKMWLELHISGVVLSPSSLPPRQNAKEPK